MRRRLSIDALLILGLLALGILYCTTNASGQELRQPTLTEILSSVGEPPAVAANRVFWDNLERATPNRVYYLPHGIWGVDRCNTGAVVFQLEVTDKNDKSRKASVRGSGVGPVPVFKSRDYTKIHREISAAAGRAADAGRAQRE